MDLISCLHIGGARLSPLEGLWESGFGSGKSLAVLPFYANFPKIVGDIDQLGRYSVGISMGIPLLDVGYCGKLIISIKIL